MSETYFHCSPVLLGEGSVIRRGNWGRIIRTYTNNWGNFAVAFRERILEDIRIRDFPSKPSRLNSVFLLPDLESVEVYQNHQERKSLVAYEVELCEAACTKHVGDWTFCFWPDDSFYFDEFHNHAREYWQGHGAGNQEILVDSDVRVLRQVEQVPLRSPRPDRMPKVADPSLRPPPQ